MGVIAGVGLWGDIRNTVQPGQYGSIGDNKIELSRALDGHYYVTAQVNGEPVDFFIDTGATNIVLTQDDAQRVGFTTSDLAFVGRSNTANGIVSTAPVRLDSPVERTSAGLRDRGARHRRLLGRVRKIRQPGRARGVQQPAPRPGALHQRLRTQAPANARRDLALDRV